MIRKDDIEPEERRKDKTEDAKAGWGFVDVRKDIKIWSYTQEGYARRWFVEVQGHDSVGDVEIDRETAIRFADMLMVTASAMVPVPAPLEGFTQTVVAETHYMRDGTVVEKEFLPTAVERIAMIIDPAAFMPSPAHGPSIVSHAVATTKAREIVTFFNQIIAESRAYKQWIARGCPK